MNTNNFKTFTEYKAFNNQFPNFRKKTLEEKRADWDAYLLRRKNKAVKQKARREQNNRQLTAPALPPRNRRRGGLNYLTNQSVTGPRSTPNILSECVLLYAQASIDPFTKLTKNPCIPDSLSVPSFKFSAKVETMFEIGTQGMGFVAVNPWAMVANNYEAIEIPNFINRPVICTTSDYDDGSLFMTGARVSTVPPQLSVINSNSPFTVDFMAGKPTRLVACGVEIEYTGQLLNQSGAITVLQNDGLQPWLLGQTVDSVKMNPRSRTCANSKDNRCYVTYYPTDQEFLSYKPADAYLASVLNNGPSNHPLLIVVSGATTGISFMVRVIAYFETQIPNADATPSESDPIAYPAFQAARTQMLPSDNPTEDLKTVLKNTVINIGKSVSGMGGTIGGALGAFVGQPAAGAAIGSAAGNLLSSILGS